MKYLVSLKGKTYEVEVERGEAILVSVTDTPAPAPTAAPAAVTAPAAAPENSAPPVIADGEPITAPMPGAIVSVKVKVGQPVKKGDLIALLEAMKMENEIFAPRDGTVVQVAVSNGAKVKTGDVIVVLK